MSTYQKEGYNKVERHSERGKYSKKEIFPIIDDAPICHVGFEIDGRPFVIPTIHARIGDTIYIHGSKQSRMLQLNEGGERKVLCVTMTIMDGLVIARTLFGHSMNYRSVVAFGKGRLVEDESEKYDALFAITEKLIPGRWSELDEPTPAQWGATSVVAIEIDSASAKIRSGPPQDPESDCRKPIWAGEIPLSIKSGEVIPDEKLGGDYPIPKSIQEYNKF